MKRALKTLDRVLSQAGVASRAQASRLILNGRVQVNARVVRKPDYWVDLNRDRVGLDGRPLAQRKRIYLLLHKPAGYVTTRSDPEGRPTVYDLLGDFREWIFPVGRLDVDTSGLLLLTNDTAFGDRLTDPRYKVPKTYLIKTASRIEQRALEQLRCGVALRDGLTLPAQVSLVRHTGPHSWLEITITEGRNRQIRRMLRAVGNKVLKLVRTRIGNLEIGRLPPGRYRRLSSNDILTLESNQVVNNNK